MASVQSSLTKLEISVSDSFEQLCLTDSTLDLTIESDDTTNMCSEGWKTTKSQIRQVGFSGNGIFETTSTAYAKLKARFVADSNETESGIESGWGQCVARATDASNGTYTGVMQINSLGQAASHNQEVRFSADFQFSGKPTIA